MTPPPSSAILFLRNRCHAPTHSDSPFSTWSGAFGLVVSTFSVTAQESNLSFGFRMTCKMSTKRFRAMISVA